LFVSSAIEPCHLAGSFVLAPTPFEIAAEIDAAKANPGQDQEEAEKNALNAFQGQRQGGG
jgi:hypothetical protein